MTTAERAVEFYKNRVGDCEKKLLPFYSIDNEVQKYFQRKTENCT